MVSQDVYKYTYYAFLVMSLLKISDASFSFRCPVQSHWKHRADNICGSNRSYFCLYDKNKNTFVEFCRDHPDFEAPGRKNVVAGSSNGTLQRDDCNNYFYQPFKFLTSGNSHCVYKTSNCSEEGQVVYKNGTKKNDTLCRCDYTRGYHFIIQPKHRCYCGPSEEDCSCHLKECQANFILSPDYECLNENEWKLSFHCDAISPVVLPQIPEIPLRTDNSSLKAYVIANGKSAGAAVLVMFMLMLSLPIIVLVLPIIEDCLYRMKSKRQEAEEKTDLEKQELKGKICQLEESIGKTPDHVLEWRKERVSHWSKVLVKFVVTRAAQFVYQRIQTEKLVAIVGPTGTGKSACAYHTAFRLMSEYEYTIISAQKPSDLTQYYLPGTNQVFIIDDFIGKYEFDETEAVLWDKEGPLIHKILSNNDKTKVILTCRKSIWLPEVCERFGLSASVCDIHTDELRLTLSEKRTICEAYLDKVDIQYINDEIIMMYPFLPSLCSIFSSQNVCTVENFFTLPVQFIEKEINNYKLKSSVRYISLAVLAIKQTITKHVSHVNIENEELIKSLFLESGSQILPSKRLIVSQLEALTDTYVTVDNDGFEFTHLTMQAIVLYCIAKTCINSVLKYSKSNVIKNQVGLTCVENEQTIPVITITPEHEEAYFSRLAKDLCEGQFVDVFGNAQSTFPIFRQKFLEYLKNNGNGRNWKTNADGLTVLHVVSSLGYEDFVSYFIKLDTGMINKSDAKGNTSLHLASINGHLGIVKLLVEDGRNVHILNTDKLSPFFYACENNIISVVNYLISLPNDVAKINEKYMTREHKCVLHITCLKGYTKLTKILLHQNATVDVQDKGGVTPLHLACLAGQYDTAALLLKARATVNALDKLERTPVYYACSGDHKTIVELLIENKANIDKSSLNGSTPLHAACEKGSIDIMQILLKNGSKVDAQEKSGDTPLHVASRNGNEDIVKFLIGNKASVNAQTKDKMIPFHEACKHGHRNVVDILLKNDVNFEKQNVQGWTGIFFSCANGNNDIVEIILSRQTDINHTDKDRVTALHVACMNNNKEVVITLLEKKANINLKDVHGETPLYKACVNGYIEIVKILLSNGAKVKICESSGLTPLGIAKGKGFSDIVALLNNVKI